MAGSDNPPAWNCPGSDCSPAWTHFQVQTIRLPGNIFQTRVFCLPGNIFRQANNPSLKNIFRQANRSSLEIFSRQAKTPSLNHSRPADYLSPNFPGSGYPPAWTNVPGSEYPPAWKYFQARIIRLPENMSRQVNSPSRGYSELGNMSRLAHNPSWENAVRTILRPGVVQAWIIRLPENHSFHVEPDPPMWEATHTQPIDDVKRTPLSSRGAPLRHEAI